MKRILVFALIGFLSVLIPDCFGHGLGSETLPPVKVGDTEVTLFAQIVENPFIEGKEIGIELYDTATRDPIPETTYFVKAIKNDKIIFEHTFQRDNIGLLIHLIPNESGNGSVEETDAISQMESFLGIDKVFRVESPIFYKNGLYLFEIKILTINSFENSLQDPIVYNFGLSFPDSSDLKIEDEKLGSHELRLISYLDQIDDFRFNKNDGSFSFEIPYDWSAQTINQTFVVHHELLFPKDLLTLTSANFSAYLNGIRLDDNIFTIDDYSSQSHRIVHLVINQNYLQEISKQNENTKKMEFILVPIYSKQTSAELVIPHWIKNNAKWWASQKINDEDFSNGLEFLINEGILTVPKTKSEQVIGNGIPSWIRNNAGWWGDGLISDEEFVKGIQYLIENGIIKVI